MFSSSPGGRVASAPDPPIRRFVQVITELEADGFGPDGVLAYRFAIKGQREMSILINGTMVFVYALPERMSDGFAFGGPKPITFGNVDWFNGFDGMTEADLKKFVLGKKYAKEHSRLLVLSPDNDIAMFVDTAEASR